MSSIGYGLVNFRPELVMTSDTRWQRKIFGGEIAAIDFALAETFAVSFMDAPHLVYDLFRMETQNPTSDLFTHHTTRLYTLRRVPLECDCTRSAARSSGS